MENKNGANYLRSESPKLLKFLSALKEIDFELAYLVLLTAGGIKPLSRWEKSLSDKNLELLQQSGLITEQIRRIVKTGNEVFETIFSFSPFYIELYRQRFSDTAIDKSAETQRFEGFLFGYPPCCIEQYIKQPYAKNNLSEEDLKILFHWPCSNCKVTPALIESYRNAYTTIRQLSE